LARQSYYGIWGRCLRICTDNHYRRRYDGAEMLTSATMANKIDWQGYRKAKLRLIVLLVGWIPFGIFVGALLPIILHTYTASYVLAVAYMLLVGWSWLEYGFYPCPECGISYRGPQLYRKTCPKCGAIINH
jgi:hypothetical protein